MSWATASSTYSPTVMKRHMAGSTATLASIASAASVGSTSSEEGASGPVRTTDQADGDVIVPLVIWNDPPNVEISCLHVLYLPMTETSSNASALMNRWPSLASFVQQWSSQQNMNASLRSMNSTHSMINLRRVLSRQKSKRGSLTPEERAALLAPVSGKTNADRRGSGGPDLVDDDDFQYVDDYDLDTDDELFQLCVFAGTIDGMIVYWLLEQDVVVQASMLVHPTAHSTANYTDELESGGASRNGAVSPIRSIVSGIDEWGQHNMISVAEDGAIARWELPNGACSRADAALARQLAPVKGMEMFCNNRYAIVYGEQSRMMVLDTWKLVMLYCVDTAQEQVRRGIAVVELKVMYSSSKKTQLSSIGSDIPLRRVSDVGPTGGPSPSSHVIGTGNSQSTPDAGLPSTSGNGSSSLQIMNPRNLANHIWDSLVISLGSEGLVKCFLWSKPRGGGSSASSVVGGSTSSYQWVQESCWVISWADDADDITCSQSTSLKDGDNMNPQTALMRSIKGSYFPRRLRISHDSSLLLFVWDNKWVVLKRKWLCDISPPGSKSSASTASRSASWKYGAASSAKLKASKYVGSCRTHPAVFLGRTIPESPRDRRTTKGQVWWEDGAFLDDNNVILWTNTGHVFQFPVRGTSLNHAGKLFVFTKDQDQLVPRSYHKTLNAVENAEFVTSIRQCECCKTRPISSSRVRKGLQQLEAVTNLDDPPGFTYCVTTHDENLRSLLSTSTPSVRLVHVCSHGSVASWNLSARLNPSGPSSPPRTSSSNSEEVIFHSLSEGFVRPQVANSSTQRTSVMVTHLILGREDSRSSLATIVKSPTPHRRRRRQAGVNTTHESSSLGLVTPSSNAASVASNMIANALGPVSALLPGSVNRTRRKSLGGALPMNEYANSEYLLDVPIIAKGYSDGSVEFSLLGSPKSPHRTDASNDELNCKKHHQAQVLAIAHCFWPPTPLAPPAQSSGQAPSMTRSTTTGSLADAGSNGVYMSARKAKVSRRGAPMEESCLASDKNPFFRARFPPPAQRRSLSNRHLSIHHSASAASLSPPPAAATTPTRSVPSGPSLNFVAFSGCGDGVLCISELTLRSSDSSGFEVDVNLMQRFRKHDGPIREISISPWTRPNSVCPERFVATIGQDNTVNIYAPVYLQNPYTYGPQPASNGHAPSKTGIEWECILELREHADTIRSLEWMTDRGQVIIECDDGMAYVWSLDTGILERALPDSLVYDGGNLSQDDSDNAEDSTSSVQCSKLTMGDSSIHLIKFNVNKSAEVIKANWKAFYSNMLQEESMASLESNTASIPKTSTSSPYAVGSIELLLLEFLLSWGATPDIDRACRELLGLNQPRSLYSCVLLDGTSGALSIPLPWKSVFSPLSSKPGENLNPFARKWQHSSALSATIALGILSLCMNLMEHKYSKFEDSNEVNAVLPPSSPKNKEEFHVLWSQLITQHSVVLPDYVPFFREPSLEFLAKYGFHPCDYTQLAARALLSSSIKRLNPTARSALCAEYSTKLHCEIVRLEMETGGKLNGSSSSGVSDASVTVTRLGSLVILLSMIGTCYPGEISPSSAREVCDILVSLLRAPVQHVASVAAELLTKGLMLFRPHLVDLSSLITQLLFIDLREKQRNPGGDSPTFGSNARVLASGGSNAALSLLVELGACETAFVLTLLQQEMNNADRPHPFRECILLYLTELINTHYLLMFRHLPSVVDTVMCCLDPTKPERRKRCLELSTRCLHNLVRRFPMVDFHKDTQRLAVGTMEAVILIYDLRTATKWRVLDGHTSAVSAVSFRTDGQILVSYAAREGSVRWWNSGNAGLFGGMLKMQQSCIKEHKLGVLKGFANAPASSGGASADLKQVIQTCRFQFLVLKEAPSGNDQQSSAGGERKVLRLTREDASQVQFLM